MIMTNNKDQNTKKDGKAKDNGQVDKTKMEKVKKERDKYLDGWKRAKADFVNYKNNEIARLESVKKREKKKILLDLLEIMDSFALAEKNIPETEKNDYLIGLLNIKKQLEKLLDNYGIREIETVGKEFDPNLHEAAAIVVNDSVEDDIIVEEINKGYLLDGELLRAAKVKVAK